MNIHFFRRGKRLSWLGKTSHFFRRSERLNLHRGQLLHHDPDQHGNQKIVEYQDRWTMPPSRTRIWLSGSGNHTQDNNTRFPW